MWAFSSEFDGNDTIEGGTSEIAVKDLRLEMALSEVDSIKTITVNAFMKEGIMKNLFQARWLWFMSQGCSAFCQ